MSELAKPNELAQSIVLGWSLGRDPDSKARAYLARWVPLLPGINGGTELPVHTTVYQARINRSSGWGLLSLVLAGPLGALAGLLPQGKFVGPGVVVACLTLGAACWRRSPSIWERGAFVRLLGQTSVAETIPQLAPHAPRVTVRGAAPATPPHVSTPLPPAAVPSPELFAASLQAGPAVPRMPISYTPDWSAPQPAPALETPAWAPADVVLPSVPLPAWPPGSAHPMGGSFETLVGTTDTQPPSGAAAAPALDTESPIPRADRRAPNAELSIDAGPDAGRICGAGDSPVKVGRASDNDFVLIDPRTSRHHAQIELRGDQFWIVDLASANGTLVNNERVSERALGHGDLIRVGQNKMSFRLATPELSLI
jgi:FHA domain-containing protein